MPACTSLIDRDMDCRHGHRHERGQSQGLLHTGSAQKAQQHCRRRLPSSLSASRTLPTERPHTGSVQCSRVDGLDARVASDHLGWVIASMLGAHLHLHHSRHPRSIRSSSLCQRPQRPLWRSARLYIAAEAEGHRLRTCPLPRRRQQACISHVAMGRLPGVKCRQASLLTLKVSPLLTTILGAAPVVGMHCHLEAQIDLPGPSSRMQPASLKAARPHQHSNSPNGLCCCWLVVFALFQRRGWHTVVGATAAVR